MKVLMFPQHLHIQAPQPEKQREVVRNSFVLSFIFFEQTCIYLYEQTRRTFFELQSFAANACYLDLHKD